MRPERQKALEAMKALEEYLRKLADKTGELRLEARRLGLLRLYLGDSYENTHFDRVLQLTSEILGFVENWTDCAHPDGRKPKMSDVERYQSATLTLMEFSKEIDSASIMKSAATTIAGYMQAHIAKLGVEQMTKRSEEQEELFESLLDPTRKAVYAVEDALCELADAVMKDVDG